MSKPDPPAPPDYQGAANAQGNANLQSSLATNYLNQVNQITPQGSLQYYYSTPNSSGLGGGLAAPGGGTTPSATATPSASSPSGAPGYQIAGTDTNGYPTFGTPTNTTGSTPPAYGHYVYNNTDGSSQYVPETTAVTTLSPEQQTLYNQNVTLGTDLNNLAIRGVGFVDDATKNPLTADQFGKLQNAPGVKAVDPMTGRLQTSYDFSHAGAMPSASDFGAQRDQVTQALLDRLQPTIEHDREAQAASLANQGINLGSQAYGYANANQERNINDQRLSAVLAGSQEQQRLFEDALGLRQQGVNEAVQQGNFNNAAIGQGFNQDVQSNQLAFNQGLAANQFNNQTQQQGIQEADFFKNQPINLLNALRTGNPVTMPTFGNVATGAQVAAAPIYQATNDQYQAQLQAYQAQMAASGGLLGGLGSAAGGLGAAAIMHSDRRLKENIKLIGRHNSGLGIYSFNYKRTGDFDIGYMADEVEKLYPEAVSYDDQGYAMVDYGAVK